MKTEMLSVQTHHGNPCITIGKTKQLKSISNIIFRDSNPSVYVSLGYLPVSLCIDVHAVDRKRQNFRRQFVANSIVKVLHSCSKPTPIVHQSWDINDDLALVEFTLKLDLPFEKPHIIIRHIMTADHRKMVFFKILFQFSFIPNFKYILAPWPCNP